MTLDDADIRLVLDAWPADDVGLPASVRAAFDAWDALRMPAINDDAAVGFLTPRGGGFNKKHKCRTLAVHSVAAPGGGATPLPAELRTLLPAGGGDAVSAKLRALEDQLVAAQSTIASLVRQQAAIEDNNDVTTDYEICATVLGEVPASFVSSLPLATKVRQKLLRDHAGSYPDGTWPNKLVMRDATRNSKDMQKAAKYTLPQFAGEVATFMKWNGNSTKMAGTTWSRVLDMQVDLQETLDADPEAWFRADDVLKQLVEMGACAEATFRFGLDTSVNLRLNVAKKVDAAMGISHLRVDPHKKASDDFISTDTYLLVEEEAKKKQNLTWAKAGDFPGSKAGNFSRNAPPKSSGGGNKPSGGGRGGRGNGGGKGRGRGGKGKGGGKGRGSGNKGGDQGASTGD